MTAHSRSKPEQSGANTRDIPTLTDIAESSSAPSSANRPAVGSERPTARGGRSDRKALERLIYKRLHRRLPQLAQELAADIMVEVEANDKTEE